MQGIIFDIGISADLFVFGAALGFERTDECHSSVLLYVGPFFAGISWNS